MRRWWFGVFLLAGCAPKSPCGRLAAAICDEGTAAECEAFVQGQMATRRGPLGESERESACQIVFDDAQTRAAFERAYLENRTKTGG